MDYVTSLVSGGLAGTCTDLFFFPIDTLKTRLQAKGGFIKNGAWHGVYKGVGSAIVASAPGASLFFITYDEVKRKLIPEIRKKVDNTVLADGLGHMTAASLGEVAACTIRVPAEVVKQRTQTGQYASSWKAFQSILSNQTGEGVWRGLYRGWASTIMREIPFTMIQFPLYEWLKLNINTGTEKIQGAVCGSIAGAIAAATTTPLDVIKTRLMLMKSRKSVWAVASELYREEGFSVFWRGIGPRTMWISAGGAIFLGVYEFSKQQLTGLVREKNSRGQSEL